MSIVRISLIQLGYTDDESVADRVQRAARLVREQAGRDLVVLPELWAPSGFGYRSWAERAEPTDGEVAMAMAAAAREAGVVLHAGSIIERSVETGPEGKRLWNTSLVFDRAGQLASVYRKIHRFGFAEGEPSLLEAGSEVAVVDLPLSGSGAAGEPVGLSTCGLSTCYDLRFPELYRRQLDAGAEVFVVPAAWPAARVVHWSLLARARAVENQCLMIACNTAGTHAGVRMGGRSVVVLPTGEVAAEAGEDEEILAVEVDLNVIAQTRAAFPVLRDRRL
jgi:predicted amidohydrolase